MKTFTALTAAVLTAFAGIASAQSNASPGTAATTTGTSTSQQEMNRGVPGVDVDAGRNASGAVDVSRDRVTNTSNAPGVDAQVGRDDDMNRANRSTRAARADRG